MAKLQKGKAPKKPSPPTEIHDYYKVVMDNNGRTYDYPTEVSAVMFALSNSHTVGAAVINKFGEEVATFYPRRRELSHVKAPSGPELQQRAKEAKARDTASAVKPVKKTTKPLRKKG